MENLSRHVGLEETLHLFFNTQDQLQLLHEEVYYLQTSLEEDVHTPDKLETIFRLLQEIEIVRGNQLVARDRLINYLPPDKEVAFNNKLIYKIAIPSDKYILKVEDV